MILSWAGGLRAQSTYYVDGDTGNDANPGSMAQPFDTIQAGLNAAAPGDTVHVYAAAAHYDEHLTCSTPNVILQGDTAGDRPSLAPTAGGTAMILIEADGVEVHDFNISGKLGTGGGVGTGGRAEGYGILIDDADDVVIEDCAIAFSARDNIRWTGTSGNVTIRRCFIHHSDQPKRNIRIMGGGDSLANTHLIEDCLIHSGQGILVSDSADYVTIRRNVIKGWSYWGHLDGDPNWPEAPDGSHGGGWRYFSSMVAGVWVAGAASDLIIQNNLILGGYSGVRVETTGAILNNTIVNPLNMSYFDHDDTIDATAVRDNTFGIMIGNGFNGTIQNNIVAVTPDNRADGQAASSSPPYYTPGITGYGIGFDPTAVAPALGSSAEISHNNVWGFVDIDGSTSTNWDAALATCGDNSNPKCSANMSQDPQFASDTSDDTTKDATRPYELYEDNYFLKSTRALGSCHADVRSGSHGGTDYLDLSTHGEAFAALTACSFAADAGGNSPCIDFGSGPVGDEPEKNGDAIDLGAFGGIERASRSPTLRIVGIDVGDDGVKDSDASYSGPGIIQPSAGGIVEVNIYFNRAVSVDSSNFLFRDHCDESDVTAPSSVSGGTTPPYKVTLTWPSGTFENQWLRIHALGSDPVNRIVDSENDALDGDISDIEDGSLPSGDGTAASDAEFVVGALEGDADGDGE